METTFFSYLTYSWIIIVGMVAVFQVTISTTRAPLSWIISVQHKIVVHLATTTDARTYAGALRSAASASSWRWSSLLPSTSTWLSNMELGPLRPLWESSD